MRRFWHYFSHFHVQFMILFTIVTVIAAFSFTVFLNTAYTSVHDQEDQENYFASFIQTMGIKTVSLYLGQKPVNRDALHKWLQETLAEDEEYGSNQGQSVFSPTDGSVAYLAITDLHGQVITSVGPAAPLPGQLLTRHLSASELTTFHYATQLAVDPMLNVTPVPQTILASSHVFVARAVLDVENRPLGVVVFSVTTRPPVQNVLAGALERCPYFLMFILQGAPVLFIIALPVGLIVGRRFVRRFRRLLLTADQWGRGNFSSMVHDTGRDELGQLAHYLNGMARQLQSLLATRQKVATLQERDRLAQSLHHTLKEQVSSLNDQIQRMQYLQAWQSERIQSSLQKAQQTTESMQAETSDLIYQLRPAANDDADAQTAFQVEDQPLSTFAIIAERQLRGEHRLKVLLMKIGQFLYSFQWKFIFSFMLITFVAAFSFSEFALIAENSGVDQDRQQTYALTFVDYLTVRTINLLLVQQPVNRHDLQTSVSSTWQLLKDQSVYEGYENTPFEVKTQLLSIAVVDKQGRVLAADGVRGSVPPLNASVWSRLPVNDRKVLQATLQGKSHFFLTSGATPYQSLFLAQQVTDTNNTVLGAVIFFINYRAPSDKIRYDLTYRLFPIANDLLKSSPLLLLIAGTMAFLTARGFTLRFRRLMRAADQWSQGNFAYEVHDRSHDELGQLTRSLNAMARQLKMLVTTRQQLAILEERNRLARDLHDSVKQQMFVTAMLIYSSRQLHPQQQYKQVQTYLQQARDTLKTIQEEISAVIHQLHPLALTDHTIVEAIREYAFEWSRQNGIFVYVTSFHEDMFQMLTAQEQEALLRISQEALSNIARHSGAWSVEISLSGEEEHLVLLIRDNGTGFDARQVQQGVGLYSMQERMKMLGGTVEVSGIPGQGTTVIVRTRKVLAASSIVDNRLHWLA